MFGVLVDYGEDEAKTFKMFDDKQEAIGYNFAMAFSGYDSTLFEYDKGHNEFIEGIA